MLTFHIGPTTTDVRVTLDGVDVTDRLGIARLSLDLTAGEHTTVNLEVFADSVTIEPLDTSLVESPQSIEFRDELLAAISEFKRARAEADGVLDAEAERCACLPDLPNDADDLEC